ncbi:MAG: ATP-binding protein [Actinomycetota bacterium]|nr:ATP-binding protein [Actinomycetota bacterium]
MSRLGIRHRLLLIVVLAIAAALGASLLGFNLLLNRNLQHDANDVARSRAASALAQIRLRNGRLTAGETSDQAGPDSQVWIFSRSGKELEAPRAGEAVTSAAQRLARGPSRFADVWPARIRLFSAPVVEGKRRLGTVVAAVSLSPYERTRETALIASVALGLTVLLVIGFAVRWLLASALRPVARMTRQASEWSDRDLDRRFRLGGPHDELRELASTLDGLLDRLAASLRREQRFSAELSHELRTPLARVIAETELALRRERAPEEYREALEIVHRNARQLARTADALVAAARHEAGTARGTADAFAVASSAAEACAGRGGEVPAIEVEPPPQPVRVGVDRELAERILQPLLENACRYGRDRVRVSIGRDNDTIVFSVEDDGPGVEDDDRERIFEPGVRGANANGAGGAGLGLALARRLARSADGDVEVASGHTGGHFVVRLPAG